MNDKPLMIADFLEDFEESKWLEYPEIPGFRVLLAAPDNPVQVRLATQVAGIADIPARNAEYHFRKVREYVAGWEGLKIADLGKLFPGKKLRILADQEVEADQEFPFLPENADFLLRKSAPFYCWVNAQVNAREVQEAADLKN
jgi:hypothetical protein